MEKREQNYFSLKRKEMTVQSPPFPTHTTISLCKSTHRILSPISNMGLYPTINLFSDKILIGTQDDVL